MVLISGILLLDTPQLVTCNVGHKSMVVVVVVGMVLLVMKVGGNNDNGWGMIVVMYDISSKVTGLSHDPSYGFKPHSSRFAASVYMVDRRLTIRTTTIKFFCV